MLTIKVFCVVCVLTVIYHNGFCKRVVVDEEIVKDENNSTKFGANVLSMFHLQNLAKNEEKIYFQVKNYVTELEERIRIMEKYLEDYEDSSLKDTVNYSNYNASEKAHLVAEHPFMSYRMIRRFSKEFDALVKHKIKKLENKFLEEFEEIGKVIQWPSQADVEDASKTILRLQYVYNIPPKELFAGNYGGVLDSVGITLSQGLELADVAHKNEFHTLAVEWINFVHSEIQNNENYSKFDQSKKLGFNVSQIAEKCGQISSAHDKTYKKIKGNTNLYIYDRPITGSQNYRSLRAVNLEKYSVGRAVNISEHESAHYNFISLCNGINLQTEKVKSELNCWLERNNNAYFAINPLKMELLNKDPYLVQIYDCISDKWIEIIRNVSIAKFQTQNSSRLTDKKITFSATYLEKEEIPEELKLTRRLELISNLNLHHSTNSNPLNVLAYDFGGHISIHYDAKNPDTYDESFMSQEECSLNRDRAATFLLYMSTLEKGGQTVFPFLGTAVRPVKGSVVLWFNLHKNGGLDMRMVHGSCPVLLGHKWSVQHWAYQSQNMLQRPCSLDPSK